MPAQQPPGALDGVTDVEQLADQRLDPAQGPPLVPGEPVRQRALPQLQLQPGPLPRRQPLPRHRPPGPQRRRASIPPGLPPPPHRPLRHPQIRGDLRGAVPAGEPPGRIQPQPLAPLLLGGRIPATLPIPHALVIHSIRPASLPPAVGLYEFKRVGIRYREFSFRSAGVRCVAGDAAALWLIRNDDVQHLSSLTLLNS